MLGKSLNQDKNMSIFHHIQSSVIITWSNITWYCVQRCNGEHRSKEGLLIGLFKGKSVKFESKNTDIIFQSNAYKNFIGKMSAICMGVI